MPAKTKRPKSPSGTRIQAKKGLQRPMSVDDLTRESIRMGRAEARKYIALYPRKTRRLTTLAATGRANLAGVEIFALGTGQFLIAKGDSWFSYGTSDILHVLGRKYSYQVDGIANTGARIVQVANDGYQLTL